MFGIDMAGRDADPAGFLRAMRAQTKGLAGFRYFSDHDPRVFDLVMADPRLRQDHPDPQPAGKLYQLEDRDGKRSVVAGQHQTSENRPPAL